MEQPIVFLRRAALAVCAGLFGVQCGGAGSSAAGPSPTTTTTADYVYMTGIDAAWGFRFSSSGDSLQVVPGSPMFYRRIPVFHPQGRIALVENGLTLALHTVNADGTFVATPLQTINLAAAVTSGPAPPDIGLPFWNADGSMVAISGYDLARGSDVSLFFFSYSNERLTPVPGTPFATKSSTLEGGFLGDVFYNYQLNGINGYRVSPSRVESIQVLARPNTGLERLRFIGDRVVVVGASSYLRQADGTLRPADRVIRSNYSIDEARTFEAGPRSILYQGTRLQTGETSVFVATFGEDGVVTTLTDEAVLGRPLTVNVVRGVARNGRVIFTATPADPLLRPWFIRDDRTFAPSQATTVPIGSTPSSLWAVDRTQEFMYSMSTTRSGIVGLRVGADGRATTFDVPAGNPFQLGAPYAVAYNTR